MPDKPISKLNCINYLAACGQTVSEIGSMLTLDEDEIRNYLADQEIMNEIKGMRQKLYGQDTKSRFDSLVPHGQALAEEILLNPNMKPSMKWDVAKEVFDRSLGKPKQTVEHEGSILRKIYESISRPKSDIIDVAVKEVVGIPALENPNSKTIEVDPISEWVNKNI